VIPSSWLYADHISSTQRPRFPNPALSGALSRLLISETGHQHETHGEPMKIYSRLGTRRGST